MMILAWMMIGMVLVCSTAHARELERYLIGPEDLPSNCQRLTELFPLNEKVSKFHEGTVYRSVVPAPIDRHTQSFDCDGQKGTLYFYQYPTENDKEQALLFARPVLTQTAGAPSFVDWKNGFVVLSYATPPETLRQHLLEKISAGPTVSTSTMTPVAPSTPTSIAASTTTPVGPSPPRPVPSITTAIVPAQPSPSPLPPVTPPPAPTPEPATETPSDISKDVLHKIRKSIECRDRTLPAELIQVCDWIEVFRKGKTVVPVIASTDTRIGLGYRVDGDGRFEREFYQAAIGSGVAGEIHLVPIYPANGVEELEFRAIATGASDGKPLPSNERMQRIANAPRPTGRTFMPTDGKSWLARRLDQTLYLRRSGKQWIILSLENRVDAAPDHYDFTITSFHFPE
jgi:hypothetical protein